MGWKKAWWQCVACPEDVEDEQAFRRGMTRSTAVYVTARLGPYPLQPVMCWVHFTAVLHAIRCLVYCRPCSDFGIQLSLE